MTAQAAIGTAFSFQGELIADGVPVTGQCDFEFTLGDDAGAGSQVGAVNAQSIDIAGGKFTTLLDFGAVAFSGDARWLEIDVCCASPCSPTFTTLTPRQALTPAPYAMRASSGIGPPLALEVDSVNNRIGIGTSTPIHPLHVFGTIYAENPGSTPLGSNVRLGAPSNDPGLVIERGNGAGGAQKRYDIAIESNNALEFRDMTTGIERIVVDTTGRVGVGTSAPGAMLTVVGEVHSTSGGFKFPDGTTQTTADTGDTLGDLACANGEVAKWNGLDWECATDEGGDGHSLDASDGDPIDAILVDANGRVGVGTNMPTEALDVSGNIHASGSIMSGNTITIDGASVPQVIHSSDALELRIDDKRVLRLNPESSISGSGLLYSGSNLLAGFSTNSITNGVVGAVISGGGGNSNLSYPNLITDHFGTIGGGYGNQAGDNDGILDDARGATVGGGFGNTASGIRSTVAGGEDNDATGMYSFVGGGSFNEASSTRATVCGGGTNRATGSATTIGGGENNQAIGFGSFIGGGASNSASSEDSVVAGGESNHAGSVCISGTNDGLPCTSSANCPSGVCSSLKSGTSVGGGASNAASGSHATVPGGLSNLALGDYSLAVGRRAHATWNGSFVWGDSTDADVTASATNQFTARTTGGARFFTNSALTTGVSLAPGSGSWSSISDRNVKRNIEQVDPRDILNRLTKLPMATWNYESQDDSIRHVGPMAQDFYGAFSVGEDERYISGIDADGVALAAIQGLHSLVEEKDCRIEELEQQNAALERRFLHVEQLVKALERRLNGDAQ